MGIFHDSFTFWFFACIAVVVFGPVGGLIFQVIYDLFAAHRLRLLRVWDFAFFAAIVVALFIAGFALSSDKKTDIDVFKNQTFDIAGAFVLLLVLVYALCDIIANFSTRQLSRTEAVNALPQHIRAFAAGGFTLMVFQGLVQGLCEFGVSIITGKPAWLILAGSIVFGGIGIALGLALLAGSSLALRWVRFLLFLAVAGGFLSFAMSMFKIWPSQNWQDAADVIVSLALLILLNWKRRPSIQDA